MSDNVNTTTDRYPDLDETLPFPLTYSFTSFPALTDEEKENDLQRLAEEAVAGAVQQMDEWKSPTRQMSDHSDASTITIPYGPGDTPLLRPTPSPTDPPVIDLTQDSDGDMTDEDVVYLPPPIPVHLSRHPMQESARPLHLSDPFPTVTADTPLERQSHRPKVEDDIEEPHRIAYSVYTVNGPYSEKHNPLDLVPSEPIHIDKYCRVVAIYSDDDGCDCGCGDREHLDDLFTDADWEDDDTWPASCWIFLGGNSTLRTNAVCSLLLACLVKNQKDGSWMTTRDMLSMHRNETETKYYDQAIVFVGGFEDFCGGTLTSIRPSGRAYVDEFREDFRTVYLGNSHTLLSSLILLTDEKTDGKMIWPLWHLVIDYAYFARLCI